MRVTVFVIGLAAALAACQTAYQGNEESPYYVVPAGSHLILNKELNFDPDRVSVYVQNGKILHLSEMQKYDPFCKFELNHLVSTARTIAPDEMSVTKALQEHSYDTVSQAGRLHYVRLALPLIAQSGSFNQGGPSMQSYVVRMDLRSEKQPEIFRMTCIRWSPYPGGYRYEYPSITEIRRTLSPLFTLRTPAEG